MVGLENINISLKNSYNRIYVRRVRCDLLGQSVETC